MFPSQGGGILEAPIADEHHQQSLTVQQNPEVEVKTVFNKISKI